MKSSSKSSFLVLLSALLASSASAFPIEPQDGRISEVIEQHEDYTTEVLNNELKEGRLSESQSSPTLQISFLDKYSSFLFSRPNEHFAQDKTEQETVPYLDDMKLEAPSQLNLVIDSMSQFGRDVVAAKKVDDSQ